MPRQTRTAAAPLVGVLMGSRTDAPHLAPAREVLAQFGVPHEVRVVSAHRTPEWMFEYARTAEGRGLKVLIAAAGGAAHLPGMVAACTLLPVFGVPMPTTGLQGVDALLSIVQMPRGVPVGTLAVGAPGAANAALLAVQVLALQDAQLRKKLQRFREARRDEVLEDTHA
jgi:5-(carboxyamino)imidazole ribonucleotide mutase